MPTQSEPKSERLTPHPETADPGLEWAARTDRARRSVFGNYRSEAAVAPLDPTSLSPAPEPHPGPGSLQREIDAAVARSFIYRLLASAYEDPAPEQWNALASSGSHASLESAVAALGSPGSNLAQSAAAFIAVLQPDQLDVLVSARSRVFGHAARGRCPLNEIEYGDLKADPLFQPHRLADIAGFYQAFGLELAPDADERPDHICLELEFMCVLAAKEAYALEHQLDGQELALCRHAQRRFLCEHLGRWAPAFSRRLGQMAAGTPLAPLADFTGAWVEFECERMAVPPGSQDLLLRPVDTAAESLCVSCALKSLPPGATAVGAET